MLSDYISAAISELEEGLSYLAYPWGTTTALVMKRECYASYLTYLNCFTRWTIPMAHQTNMPWPWTEHNRTGLH